MANAARGRTPNGCWSVRTCSRTTCARPGATKKFVYAHTPARYIWEPERDERGKSRVVRAASAVLKPIDRRRAGEATSIAVNSHFTGQRVLKAWHQPSTVIYPPVETETLTAIEDWRTPLVDSEKRLFDALKRPYLLGASRFVMYKRLEQGHRRRCGHGPARRDRRQRPGRDGTALVRGRARRGRHVRHRPVRRPDPRAVLERDRVRLSRDRRLRHHARRGHGVRHARDRQRHRRRAREREPRGRRRDRRPRARHRLERPAAARDRTSTRPISAPETLAFSRGRFIDQLHEFVGSGLDAR